MNKADQIRQYFKIRYGSIYGKGNFYENSVCMYVDQPEIDKLIFTTNFVCNSCGYPFWKCDCVETVSFAPDKSFLTSNVEFGTPEKFKQWLWKHVNKSDCSCYSNNCEGKAFVFTPKTSEYIIGKPVCKSTIPRDEDWADLVLSRIQKLKNLGYCPGDEYSQIQLLHEQNKKLSERVDRLEKILADTLATLATK